MRIFYAALLIFTACSTDRHFDGGPPAGPIAVGATLIAGAGSENCRHGERGSWCSTNDVEILSLSSQPAGIFELAKGAPGSFTVRALTEGKARITFSASDGFETKTFTGETTALAANKITVAPINSNGQPCAEPLLYGTDTTVYLPFELHRDATPLQGQKYHPFQASGVTIEDNQIYERKLGFRTPAGAVTAAITSMAVPAFALPIQVFTPAEVQEIRISEPSTPLTAPYNYYANSVVQIDLALGGRVACAASWPGTIAVQSSEECLLSAGTSERLSVINKSNGAIVVHGVKLGSCTLTVTLAGTSITATKTFPVVKGTDGR